jgi:predicted kinase
MSTEQKTVIVPRGIPGSGKTTWVKDLLKDYEPGTAVRINNDDLAYMLYGRPWGDFFFSDASRDALQALRISMLKTLLAQEHVLDVFIDNTNLSVQTVRSLEKVTHQAGDRFVVVDHFLNIDVEEAIARDAKRDYVVGEEVIRKMHSNAKRLKPWKYLQDFKPEPYFFDLSLPEIVLCDIDGTLALKHPDRGTHDYHKVHLDYRNVPVVKTVQSLRAAGHKVILMSGRVEDCRAETKAWIETNVGIGFELFMRKSGDYRQDYIVKHELFQEHISGKYRVLMSLDDRDQVVNLWRNKLNIPTFQVANGDF